MEDIKCIFCKKNNDKIVIRENGYTGIKCKSCDLIYISPRPSLNEIIDLYGHDQADASAKSHIDASSSKAIYARHTLKIINKYIQKGKLLEIGAGGGYFLNEARKKGFNVCGIEFNEIQSKFINQELGIPCVRLPLSQEIYPNVNFDIIYHCDVISHFYDPIHEFEKMNLRLNKNGYVIFETGNLGDVDKKYWKYYRKFQYPDHLFFYSESNIKSLLEMTGFELIHISRYSILPQLFIKKILRKIKNFIKTENKIKKPTVQSSTSTAQTSKSRLHKFLNLLNVYIFFFIRYKLGFIVPKNRRLQTLIVVAKKK